MSINIIFLFFIAIIFKIKFIGLKNIPKILLARSHFELALKFDPLHLKGEIAS